MHAQNSLLHDGIRGSQDDKAEFGGVRQVLHGDVELQDLVPLSVLSLRSSPGGGHNLTERLAAVVDACTHIHLHCRERVWYSSSGNSTSCSSYSMRLVQYFTRDKR